MTTSWVIKLPPTGFSTFDQDRTDPIVPQRWLAIDSVYRDEHVVFRRDAHAADVEHARRLPKAAFRIGNFLTYRQHRQLRPLLTRAHPALAAMSPARWTIVRSLILGALGELGIEVMPGRARMPLSPAWQALAASL